MVVQPLLLHWKAHTQQKTISGFSMEYCKLGNFREGFIFPELRIYEVS